MLCSLAFEVRGVRSAPGCPYKRAVDHPVCLSADQRAGPGQHGKRRHENDTARARRRLTPTLWHVPGHLQPVDVLVPVRTTGRRPALTTTICDSYAVTGETSSRREGTHRKSRAEQNSFPGVRPAGGARPDARKMRDRKRGNDDDRGPTPRGPSMVVWLPRHPTVLRPEPPASSATFVQGSPRHRIGGQARLLGDRDRRITC